MNKSLTCLSFALACIAPLAACSNGSTGTDAGGTDTLPATDSAPTPDSAPADATSGNDVVSNDATTQDAGVDAPSTDVTHVDAASDAPPSLPLVGTWSTGAVSPAATGPFTDANSQGITTFTYTITLNADTTFNGTYTRTFSSTAPNNAGCMESWVITGWNWSATPMNGTSGSFSLATGSAGSNNTVARSGCSDATQDTSGTSASDLDLDLQGSDSENFAVTTTGSHPTLVLSPMSSFFGDGVPIDPDTYTLTKQ